MSRIDWSFVLCILGGLFLASFVGWFLWSLGSDIRDWQRECENKGGLILKDDYQTQCVRRDRTIIDIYRR